VAIDKRWRALEPLKRLAQGDVALVGGEEEGVVRRMAPGRLPDAFHGHELGRIGRQPVQLDPMAVLVEPTLTVGREPVAGAVIDDEKDLATKVSTDELLQEQQEGLAVEDRREHVCQSRLVERHRAVDVRGLAQAVRVDAGLHADSRPGAVEAAVLPEARLVLENYDAAAPRRFFLIAGSRSRTHTACASASARARRFRGRCNENPSWANSLGMCCLW
jgi:hypothetical protein